MPQRSLLRFLLTTLAVAALAVPTSSQEETRLLRFPHISGDRVVFTYAGDLYTAPLAGGTATRLTSHEGLEIFARFSPDGNWIAFSGEYAGSRQVHVIPSQGGTPRQLTWYPDVGPMPPRGGYDHLVLDWTPDGSKILVRANRTPFGERVGRYYLVDPQGRGLEQPLEIPEGATGATYDRTGTRLAYNIKSREWRHWKRYEGGRQQDVWVYDLASSSSQRITTFTGTDNFPMWVGDVVYFVSDRGAGRKLNIWAYDITTGETSQITRHADFDVLWPSRGRGGIVYENGGYIYHLDTTTNRSRRLNIRVTGDRPHTIPYHKNVADDVEGFDLSPSGRRAIFSARGEIFTAPAEHGNIRNLSNTPGARERDVAWSPDGRWISYISDATGAYELYVMAADGSGEPVALTRDGDAWIQRMAWSPDSRWIAWSDNRNRLRAAEVERRRITEVDHSPRSELSDFAWSHDSGWIAYAKTGPNMMDSIWLYSFAAGERTQVTGDGTEERNPAFDRNGDYLYFASARDFNYAEEGFDWRIYVATLRADIPHPFPQRSDEEPAASGQEQAGEESGGGTEQADAPLRVDFAGIGDRVVALPGVRPGSQTGLVGLENGLLFFSGGALQKYDMTAREAAEIIRGISGYALTPDAGTLMYRSGASFGIVPLRPGQSTENGQLDLEGMNLLIDPKVEWAQIFHDTWLIMRDWFYDPDLHGMDWEAVYARYQPLVAHVAHRADLDYLQAELIAEINTGHTYLNSSPEMPSVDRVDVALLGAEFTPDGRYFRISNIFRGENWHDGLRSPLTEPGVQVREGEYLIAIDGEEVTTDDNPYRLLVGKADRTISVTVNDRPRREGARTYDVNPIASELGLRYEEWVAENARIVEELSGGRIGYIHLPNTSIEGYQQMYEGFQPLHLKEALIFDDRYNGGGFIPDQMAFMMAAPILNYWARRNLELYSQPFVAHTGPKVMTINGQASSGGDAIPYYFRELGLGPLIGERTWGGLVGISGNPGFVDGGSISVPRFAFVNTEGEWAVEAEGVSPDIEVLDLPEEIAAGRQPILERAVAYLLEELQKPQYQRPEKPAGPIRRPPPIPPLF
ncbi:PDZ domain-containing protein [Gemmatimonadota bacterium]